jgi:predicted ATPase
MTRRRSLLMGIGLSPEPPLGREGPCAAVESLLRGGSRVVTLTGAGGIGKSRVAREVGRRLAGGGAADVVLCELGDVTDEAMLVKTVARAAGVAAPTSRGRAAVETLARRLAASHGASPEGPPLLVVLDDADGVVAAAATLVPVCLEACEGLRFLVTSREAVGIAGEHREELGPLDATSARALFEASADGGSWSHDELTALVEQLDGLPLAIELAARRSKLVPPGDLLARIEERFRLLKTDRRDVTARHATLSATIAWSVARLDADEARAFSASGAFEGAVTVEAFEAVVAPLLAGDPVDVIEALLRKSLLASVESDGAVRLTMLRSVRAFARLELAAVDAREREALELRHARLFVGRAETAGASLYGASADDALDAIEADLPELLRAFERQKSVDPALAARAVIALGDVVLLRNALDLRGGIFREACVAADAGGDDELRVRARIVAAKVILEVGAAASAEALLVEALTIATAASLDDAADVQRSLGWARIALGDAAGALGPIEAALAFHRQQSNVRGEADALVARGLLRCLAGARPEGESDLENAYALHIMARDALRREKVREVATVVGLELPSESEAESETAFAAGSRAERSARLRATADAHHASGRLWRESVARFQLAALETADSPSPATSAATSAAILAAPADAKASTRAAWLVGADARSLRHPDGEAIDLARHGALRQVLDALVTRRLAEPGVALSASALLAAGWPGERVRHESGMLRVYSIIRRIRALGLAEALVTRDDGYLLDPHVGFERL